MVWLVEVEFEIYCLDSFFYFLFEFVLLLGLLPPNPSRMCTVIVGSGVCGGGGTGVLGCFSDIYSPIGKGNKRKTRWNLVLLR